MPAYPKHHQPAGAGRRSPGNPRMDGRVKRRHRSEGPERAPLFAGAACWSTRARAASTCRSRPIPVMSTPSKKTRRSAAPATSRSKSACVPTCAGTPWPWWSRPTAITRKTVVTWVGTLARLLRWRTCLAPVLTISGTPSRARPWWRLHLHPGPCGTGCLCAGLPGRAADRRAVAAFPPGNRGQGLSSYPHPKLMPEFWQFPTVSMGLGPLMAIYQARF
jgi:hypothetical protein